jgi:hypothetical protein
MGVKAIIEPNKISSGLSGVAGEYYVAAELTRLGFIASLTLRNAKGVDILATNLAASKTAAIQVKTNQNSEKCWIMNQKSEAIFGENFFYIFVNLGSHLQQPEYHIVPSAIVAKFIKDSHALWLNTPGKQGQKRKETTMRKYFDLDNEYLGRWELLGLSL